MFDEGRQYSYHTNRFNFLLIENEAMLFCFFFSSEPEYEINLL